MNDLQQPTVFIVDDDDAVRDSISELVESVGLPAAAYDSALAFLAAIEPDRPGCLVLDVRMAEMSGLALQQRLNGMGVALPVIILTGHGDVPMAVEAMKNGALDFLQKPCRDQALLDSINAAVFLSGRIPAVLNFLSIMVQVDPRGWTSTWMGSRVSGSEMR